ncbi:hypothetical protein LCGC14_2711230, partial [marine sediment metagenome]
MLELLVQFIHSQAKLPSKVYSNDAGWDISCVEDKYFRKIYPSGEFGFLLYPKESHVFSTGIKIAIPNNYTLIYKDRSGLGVKKNLHVLAGVIDCQYRGELKVCLINLGREPVKILPSDRIVQAL